MSLNWDVSKIENNEELKSFGSFDEDTGGFIPDPNGTHYQLKPELECLIWLSRTCGYNEITNHNWEEVFLRVSMVETVTGAYRRTKDGEFMYYTPAEVRRCIGLKTNSSVLSKAAFGKTVAIMLRRPSEDVLRKYYNDQLDEVIKDVQVQDAVQTETAGN